ncbi:MAG: luxQ2 [Myxococcaceae bacterium]|nr:luxQ2 [Myxococcaceae bacterium]
MSNDTTSELSPLCLDPEESFESLYEDAPCGYFSTLPDGRFSRVNRTMLAWTGYRREQLLGVHKFRDLLTTGDQIFHETHYAPLLTLQGAVSELALDIVCADGHTFPALINSALYRDEQGRPRMIRTVVIKATDRRSYERELLAARQQAELVAKAKSDFVSMLSHDIRTPLTAVVSVAEVLESSDLNPTQNNYLRLLRKGADSLMALVDNVLQNSKLESGKMKLETSVVDLTELLGELIERMRITAEGRGLSLWARFDSLIPRALLGDPIKLGQIFSNLIGNAIKFTETGWVGVTVHLGAQHDGRAEIEVCISDTGIGIDPKRIGEIFDEYTQVHEQSGRKYGGSGLGLAISKKLIALHGGTLCAKPRPGGGTIFEFSLALPLA